MTKTEPMTSDVPDDPGEASVRRRRALPIAPIAAGIVVAVAAFGLWQTWGKGTEPDAPLPVPPGALEGWNVLLVSLDTVRADRLGCYGCASARTPVLDGLAARGVRFATAIAPAPITLPSHASLMTGLNPYRHGARSNGVFTVAEEHTTLAERLAAEGYKTGAVIAAYVLDRKYGLAQGFETYDDDLRAGSQSGEHGFRERRADAVTDRAVDWLQKHREERFFLFVHYFDPHAPYEPPEPFQSEFAGRPYDGEIAYTDRQFGRLLKAVDSLGLRGRTLIVVISDHGEALGEHKEKTHGILIYDATMHVVLLLDAQGALPAGAVVRHQVGLVDVAPTVLDLLGLPPGGTEPDGVSLLRSRAGDRQDVYIESLLPKVQYGWAPLLGVRRSGVKFISAPRPELYDLASDPNEHANVIAERRPLADELHERLRAFVGGDPEAAAAVRGNLRMDDESRKRLEGLGYVFATGSAPAGSERLPDPKDMMDSWMELQRAQTFADQGAHAKALPIYEAVVKAQPRNWRAWQLLGETYAALSRHEDALAAYRKGYAGCPKPEVAVKIGETLLALGKTAEAESHFRDILADEPESYGGLFGLGSVLVREGKPQEGLTLFRRCLEVSRGGTSSAHFNIGVIHYAAKRLEEARAAFERALEDDPSNPRPARALAELMRREGNVDQAVELLEKTISLQPDAKALLALGEMRYQQGQAQRAFEDMRRALELDPQLVAAHYKVSKICLKLDRIDEALHHLRTFVQAQPSSAQARLELGVLLGNQGELEEAEAQLRKVIALSPEHATGHFNLGVLLGRKEQIDEAMQAFRRTIEFDPKHALGHTALGECLLAKGRPDEAKRHFRRALELAPTLESAKKGLQRCSTMPATTRSTTTGSAGQ